MDEGRCHEHAGAEMLTQKDDDLLLGAALGQLAREERKAASCEASVRLRHARSGADNHLPAVLRVRIRKRAKT